jgi:spore coat polysaccharide biosynthesis predicted glycosyltransferase SpsG
MDMADGGLALTKVLDRLRSRAGGLAFDVVVADGAPGLPGLERLARRDPRIVLHVDPQDMPALTAQAGMAVGATNSAAWERCTLGLPTILAIARADQRPASHLMAELDAAMVVDLEAPDFEPAFDRALALLLRDGDLRASLAAASARVCDGLGAGRVAKSLLQLIRDTRPQPESLVN